MYLQIFRQLTNPGQNERQFLSAIPKKMSSLHLLPKQFSCKYLAQDHFHLDYTKNSLQIQLCKKA